MYILLRIHAYILIDKELNCKSHYILQPDLKTKSLDLLYLWTPRALFIQFYNNHFEIQRKMSLFWLMCTYTCMIYQLSIKSNCLLKTTKSNKNNCHFLYIVLIGILQPGCFYDVISLNHIQHIQLDTFVFLKI